MQITEECSHPSVSSKTNSHKVLGFVSTPVVILTCFRFANNTAVATLAGDQIPVSTIACHHDGTLGPGLLPGSGCR